MNTPTDEQLKPYGYRPGAFLGWCAACNRAIKNAHESAFKCRPCATEQWAEVERLCAHAGVNE
jgi:hypothetical protein